MQLSAGLSPLVMLNLLPAMAIGATSDPPAIEQVQEPTDAELDDLFSLRTGLYRQIDHGGNPRVDEDAAVYEGLVFIRVAVTAHNEISGRFLGDVISAASYDRFKDQAISSGATGYNPGHLAGALGWRYREQRWDLGVEGSYGQEFAYRTIGLTLSGHRSLWQGNSQIGLTLRGFNDQVRVLRFDGSHEPDEHRRTLTADAQWTQILGRMTVANLDLTATRQDGFLATSFNSVIAGGVEAEERTPSQRFRYAATIRAKHALDDVQSLQGDYRAYTDTWEIHSHTLAVHWFRYLDAGRWLVEPQYRFCIQDATSFSGDAFSADARYRTSDPDLDDFRSHTVSLAMTRFAPWPLGSGSAFTATLAGCYRSDGLHMGWLILGVDAGF